MFYFVLCCIVNSMVLLLVDFHTDKQQRRLTVRHRRDLFSLKFQVKQGRRQLNASWRNATTWKQMNWKRLNSFSSSIHPARRWRWWRTQYLLSIKTNHQGALPKIDYAEKKKEGRRRRWADSVCLRSTICQDLRIFFTKSNENEWHVLTVQCFDNRRSIDRFVRFVRFNWFIRIFLRGWFFDWIGLKRKSERRKVWLHISCLIIILALFIGVLIPVLICSFHFLFVFVLTWTMNEKT